jgi:hypothetical protein
MEAHQNKTAKQIWDKRREATYKRLLQERATALLPEVEGEPAIPPLSTVSEDPPPLTMAGRTDHTPRTVVRPCDLEAEEPLPGLPGQADLPALDEAAIMEDLPTD